MSPLRSGFRDDGTPRGTTLCGPWWGEAGLCAIGMALERELNVGNRRPT
jgi:Asp-tRNA(Asn)/Glu-tRNA(Gln) amidotransferase A subunit family amidase